jgi:hypothetical protein
MPATDFGNGLMGYSSFPGYQQALANLSEQYPGLYSYINSFFPHTNMPGNLGNIPGPNDDLGNIPGPNDIPGTGSDFEGSGIGRSTGSKARKKAVQNAFSRNLGFGEGGKGGGGLAARGGMARGPTNINPGGGGWFGQNNSSAGGGFNHGFAS